MYNTFNENFHNQNYSLFHWGQVVYVGEGYFSLVFKILEIDVVNTNTDPNTCIYLFHLYGII